MRALTVAVSEFYYEVQTLMSNHERNSIAGLPKNLLDEWKNLFADEIHLGVTDTWMFYAGKLHKKIEAFLFFNFKRYQKQLCII